MYGIQGELVTDCRYMTAAGARAAIDSELGIAERNRYLERRCRDFYEYVEREGRGRLFGCDCGWRSTYTQLKKDPTRHALRCPKCANESVYIAVGDDAPDH